MKQCISAFFSFWLFAGTAFGQLIPAEDWTQTDCNGVEHNLFSELDAGEVVLMEIVMLDGCMPCINAAHYMAPVIEYYNANYDNRINYYTFGFDDSYSCSQLIDWKTENSIICNAQFVEGEAIAANYGGMGMPTIIVAGRSSHVVCYNKFGFGPLDTANLANAFEYALGLTETLAIDNPEKSMQVYPNPVHDVLHFDMNGTADISIKNLAGVTIMQQTGTNHIDVNSLPAGLYFYEINAATFSGSGNFIKN